MSEAIAAANEESNVSGSSLRPPPTSATLLHPENERLSKRKINELLANAFDTPMEDPYKWSDSSFDERLSTFKTSTWFGKPTGLSAPVCALRGWINTDFDQLNCFKCKGVILVPNEADVVVWLEKLKLAHNPSCIWRIRNVREDGYKFPVLGQANAIKWFKERCRVLQESPADLVECERAAVVRYRVC